MAKVADLYQVLGVDENADAEAIKKAYRTLAKKHHPDNNAGDKKAEDKFKELNQAHEVLADPEKRKRYDQMRRSPFGQQGGGDPFGQSGAAEQGFDGAEFQGDPGSINDLFEMFFGGRGRSPFGGGARETRGQDHESEVWVDFEDAALGRSVTLQMQGQDQPLKLNLPAGAEEGMRLRLAGRGGKGSRGKAGDLYLSLRIKRHARLAREGLNIVSREPMNLGQALLGGTLNVATLHGNVRLKLPRPSQPGTRMRLAGQGIQADGKKGDHLVELELKLPEHLDEHDQAALEAMAKRKGWEL